MSADDAAKRAERDADSELRHDAPCDDCPTVSTAQDRRAMGEFEPIPLASEAPPLPTRLDEEDTAKLAQLQVATKRAVLRAVLAERDLIVMDGEEILADFSKRYGVPVTAILADGNFKK